MKALAIFNRPSKPTIYEVRLEIDAGIAGEFDDWLLEHVREMLAFPGFQTATVYRGQAFDESHRVERLVVYEVRSRRELDSYLHTHAKRMRKEGLNRFGKQFEASRRILPAAEHVLPGNLAVLYDGEHISGGLPVCANCHRPVAGRFCAHCGQEDRTYMLSLGGLLYDLVGDLFNFDSRFFRTMRPLLLKPGFLTEEYLRGHRQHYLPPVRMYIFASLIFFFVAAILAAQGVGDEVNVGPQRERGVTVQGTEKLSPEERAEVERELENAEKLAGLPPGTLKLPETTDGAAPPEDGDVREPVDEADEDNNINLGFGGFATPEFEERMERAASAFMDEPRRFVQAFMQQVPTMMLVFLPVMALVLKLLYCFTGRYYVEHLIFTLHYHSAVFVMLLLYMAYGMLESKWTALETLSGWLGFALWLYLLYYLYRSMRRVYGQGRFFTIVKYVLLQFAYTIALSITLALTVLYTLYLET